MNLIEQFSASFAAGATLKRGTAKLKVLPAFVMEGATSGLSCIEVHRDGALYGRLFMANPGPQAQYASIQNWAAYSRDQWDSVSTEGIFTIGPNSAYLYDSGGHILARIHRPGWYEQDAAGDGYGWLYILFSSDLNLTFTGVQDGVSTPIAFYDPPAGDAGYSYASLHPDGEAAGLLITTPPVVVVEPAPIAATPLVAQVATDFATLDAKLDAITAVLAVIAGNVSSVSSAVAATRVEVADVRGKVMVVTSYVMDRSLEISMKADVKQVNDNVIAVGDFTVSNTVTSMRRLTELTVSSVIGNILTG